MGAAQKRFCLVLVKPSHYDDDGYVIQWFLSAIPSNSLAALYGLARDCAKRNVLGEDVAIDIHAIDETNTDFQVRRATARLWPQTEWLKAACLLGDASDVDAAAASLWRYLQTPKPGLWRDKMREDGGFVDEPAPASSLYHIICAVASLKEAA